MPLHEKGIVEEHLRASRSALVSQDASCGRKILTRTSTFLLTLQLECALMIFFTVPRGYIFCPGAMVLRFVVAQLCSRAVMMSNRLCQSRAVNVDFAR